MTWHPLSRMVLRRTGFPFEILERLAVADADAISAAGRAELAAHRVTGAALAAFPAAVTRAREDGRADTLRTLSKLRRAVATGRLDPPRLADARRALPNDLAALLDDVVAARAAAAEAGRRLRGVVDTAEPGLRDALRTAMTDPLFVQAVFLSNPDMYAATLAPLVAHPDRTLTTALQRSVWSYLQRFASKNDTASFFGPLNYASIVDGGADPPLYIETSPGRWRRREVFVSFWAVQTLAAHIAQDPWIRAWLKPHRHPMVRLEHTGGSVVIHRAGRVTRLPGPLAEFAGLVDGARSVQDIATKLGWPLEQAMAALDKLVAANAVIAAIEIPSTRFHPLTQLIEQITRLDPQCPGRDPWLADLHALDELRRQLRDAPFAERPALVARLDLGFSELTGKPPRRRAGATYADRTLFYEECQGTHPRFEFSGSFAADLLRRLRPIIDLSAAHSALLQHHYRTLGRARFDQLSPAGEPVPYTRFSQVTMAAQRAGELPSTDAAVEALRERFADLVRARSDGHVAVLTQDDVEALVGGLPTPANCHVSPDIMFAARDADALGAGDYTLVLGEVHQVIYAWGSQLYFDEQRAETEAEAAGHVARMDDYRGMAIVLTERKHKGLLHEVLPGTFIEVAAPASETSLARVAIADLDVIPDGADGLALRHRDTGERYVLYMAGDEQLHLWMLALPRVMPIAVRTSPEHTPRITLGEAVYQRERWTMPTERLGADFADLDDAGLLQRGARLRAELDMPRTVYLHVASEPKPYYVDFQAPLALRLLQHLVRANETVTFTEMLPGPDRLWLREADGRYCSEFRMTLFRYPDGPGG